MTRFHRFILAASVLGLGVSPTFAADVTDPARLFPPDTLAYAGLKDPAAVAPQLAALFKGTPLANGLKFIDARRDAAKMPNDLFGKKEIAALALLASPEMAAEFKRLGGIGVGLTGFTDQCDPQAAVAILTGESAAAGLAAQAFLATGMLRKVAEVEGVSIYQYRQPSFAYDPNDGRQKLANDKPPAEGPYEATFAYVRGLFVAGTSKEAIAPVITRFLGKAKGSLAEQPGYKKTLAAEQEAGVHFFVDVPRFCSKYDAVRTSVAGLVEPDAYAWFKMIVNHQAVKHLGGLVRFDGGSLTLRVAAEFDPAQKSPLLELLSGPGVAVEVLEHVPTASSFAVALTLPEKNRAAAVIAFLDAVGKSSGDLGRLPGEAVREIEKKYKLSVANDLIGKTRSVAVVMPVRQDLPKGAEARPMLVLFTDGEEAAAAWEAFLPKLIGDLSGASTVPQPVAETIGGVKVNSLPGNGLPWNGAIHYARQGGVFAVGLDRALVAASLEPRKSKSAVPGGKPAVLVGTMGAGGLIRLLNDDAEEKGPVVPITGVRPAARPQPRSGPAPVTAKAQQEDETKRWEEMMKALEALPPAIFVGRRSGNELHLELRQQSLQGESLSRIAGAAVNWFDTVLNRKANPNGYPYPSYGGIGGFR